MARGGIILRKAIRYDEKFKKEAVRMYLQSNFSAVDIANKLGINRHNFHTWIKQYNHGIVISPITINENPQFSDAVSEQVSPDSKKQNYLEMKIFYDKILELESELSKLEMKLNSMVDR